jgi:hypothetical protein
MMDESTKAGERETRQDAKRQSKKARSDFPAQERERESEEKETLALRQEME